MLIQETVQQFTARVASSDPAPGGGSVAALSGALGASLSTMVGGLSFGKKAFEALDESIKTAVHQDCETLTGLKNELEALIDADTAAFNAFMDAMRLPKETEAEKAARMAAMDAAALETLRVPLRTAECCMLVLEHQSNLARYGNKNALSDIGTGAAMALAGLEGALLNVRINLPGIVDEAVKAKAQEHLDEMSRKGPELAAEIKGVVLSKM